MRLPPRARRTAQIETSSDGRIRALSVTGPNGDYVRGAPRDPYFPDDQQ